MAETKQRPLTYAGADVVAFLQMADPSVLGLERIVRSLRQASAGVPRGRVVALQFARWWLAYRGEEPSSIDNQVNTWWDEATPADDLCDLAREQAERFRDAVLDFELSDFHPDVIQEFAREHSAVATELDAWADRPRTDILSQCEAECAAEAEATRWPRRLVYEHKHGAKNARLFLGQRPSRIISSDGTLFLFDTGAWAETSDDALAAEVRRTDPTDVLDVDHVAKIVKGVHQSTVVKARPFEWLDPDGTEPVPEDLAVFQNGLLDVKTGGLIPHDGRYFATGLPSHNYDPFAECPTWMRWLDDALDPSFHATLQEWFGYCLTPDTCAHSFLNLLGGTRSGKSTAHNVLRELVGPQHATSAMMPDLGSDFGMQGFLDKRVVIIPDAHDAPTRNRAAALERIKSITGGDEVSINRKNLTIVNAKLKARIVITCNRLPKFIDESGALAARMLIIHFNRSFKGREDRGMGEKLRAEMSGIANWALEGLSRLRANGFQFTVGDLGRAEVDDAARSQSPALRFAEARLTVTRDDSDFTPMAEVYRAYMDWTAMEGLGRAEVRSQTDLAHDIRAALPGVRHKQRRRDGRKVYGLTGVSRAEFEILDEF